MASICPRCLLGMRLVGLRKTVDSARVLRPRRLLNPTRSQRRWASNPADRADFVSIVDNSPLLVKTGRRHGPGLIILGKPLQLCEASLLTKSSTDTNYCFRSWHMAGKSAGLEDQTHCQIRGPFGARSATFASQGRPRGSQRL